jgi:DNA-binding response OmpR family regulator
MCFVNGTLRLEYGISYTLKDGFPLKAGLVVVQSEMHISGNQSIALVDDEENIRELIGYALRKEGYRVITYVDGEEAWEFFRKKLPDLVILDILMPRMDGLELCRKIRSVSEQTPLIFLTSRDEEFDRVLGLEMGADDYLCKPFSTRELIARVKVLFRRIALSNRAPKEEDILRCGSLEMDRQRYTVHWKSIPFMLTVTEFRILEALIKQPGHVKTREQLLQEGYPYDEYMSDRTVDTHIKRLRKKIIRVDPDFSSIKTIYGLGYRYQSDG